MHGDPLRRHAPHPAQGPHARLPDGRAQPHGLGLVPRRRAVLRRARGPRVRGRGLVCLSWSGTSRSRPACRRWREQRRHAHFLRARHRRHPRGRVRHDGTYKRAVGGDGKFVREGYGLASACCAWPATSRSCRRPRRSTTATCTCAGCSPRPRPTARTPPSGRRLVLRRGARTSRSGRTRPTGPAVLSRSERPIIDRRWGRQYSHYDLTTGRGHRGVRGQPPPVTRAASSSAWAMVRTNSTTPPIRCPTSRAIAGAKVLQLSERRLRRAHSRWERQVIAGPAARSKGAPDDPAEVVSLSERAWASRKSFHQRRSHALVHRRGRRHRWRSLRRGRPGVRRGRRGWPSRGSTRRLDKPNQMTHRDLARTEPRARDRAVAMATEAVTEHPGTPGAEAVTTPGRLLHIKANRPWRPGRADFRPRRRHRAGDLVPGGQRNALKATEAMRSWDHDATFPTSSSPRRDLGRWTVNAELRPGKCG